MDETRALLDSLMGADRNLPSDSKDRKKQHFTDEEMCKYHIADFCPHDLFKNTRNNIGPCDKIHSDPMRDLIRTSPDNIEVLQQFELQLSDFLQQLVDQVEAKIKKARERIVAPVTAKHLSDDKQHKIDGLNQQISALLKKAEEVAEKGEIEESEAITRQVEAHRRDIEKISTTPYDAFLNKEKQLRVCAVCGAMQSLGDSMSRFESHISGKQHQGYERIRNTLATLKEKLKDVKPEKIENLESTKKYREAERSRSRDGSSREERPPARRRRRRSSSRERRRSSSRDRGDRRRRRSPRD